MMIPYRCTGGGYVATTLDPFESPYSSCGWTYLSYVNQHIYTTAMSQEMFDARLTEWEKERAAAGKAAGK